MELKKLVEIGRIEVVYTVAGLGEIRFALPPADTIKTGEDPYMVIAKHITQIGDQDCTSEAKKIELVDLMKRAQPGVMTKISKICESLMKEQDQAVEDMFVKNS
jgi:hypothetical protein